MMAATFIFLTFGLLYDSYIKSGELVDMIELFVFFKGTKYIILSWLVMSSLFFGIIIVTKIALKTDKYIWMPLYAAHIGANVWVANYFANHDQLGFASVIIIMAESIRMIMKSHSYFRTKLLYLKKNNYKDF